MPSRFKKLIENDIAALPELEKRLCHQYLNGNTPFGPAKSTKLKCTSIYKYIDPVLLGDKPVIPVEGLRWKQPTGRSAKIFRSSGTTSANRSQSPYSKNGLELYRLNALYTFDWIMCKFLGEEWPGLTGISLIPSTRAWPDSSLAQMIEWISEGAELKYMDTAAIKNAVKSSAGPMWIFGTGYHFVEMIESGTSLPLPPGSIIIETGGTKGLVTAMPREEYFSRLAHMFGIPTTSIISEYGMCELASQAYDWVDVDNSPKSRHYRFPRWVDVSIEVPNDQVSRMGSGCLIVDDPFRSDFEFPIRVQDLVSLADDGGFELSGRLFGAPLKGCSLTAFQSASSPNKKSPKLKSSTAKKPAPQIDVAVFEKNLLAFLENYSTVIALAKETGSESDAKYLLESCMAGVPKTKDAWNSALANAVSNPDTCPRSWLFIAPSSHGLAMIYPLAMASLLGFEIYFRPGRALAETPFSSALLHFFERQIPDQLHVLDHSFRIGKNPVPDSCEAVFCFASSETIQELHRLTDLPIIGFGSSIAGIISNLSINDATADAIVKDSFSLGQQGCFNARFAALFHAGLSNTEKIFETFCTQTRKAFSKYWGGQLSATQALALQHEKIRFLRNTTAMVDPGFTAGSPLMVLFESPLPSNLELLSSVPFVLVCVLVNEETLAPTLNSITDLKHLYANVILPKEVRTLQISKIGFAQLQVWNGTHDGRALFAEQ